MLPLFYVLVCVLVGVIGRRSNIGFWGFFVFSLFLTPILGLIVIVLASPRSIPKRAYEQRMVKVEVKRD